MPAHFSTEVLRITLIWQQGSVTEIEELILVSGWVTRVRWGRRATAEFKDLEAATKEDREKAVDVAAENRVLIATLRSMQDECHACKVCEFPASVYSFPSKGIGALGHEALGLCRRISMQQKGGWRTCKTRLLS